MVVLDLVFRPDGSGDLEELAQPYREHFAGLHGVAETRTERVAEFHYAGQTHEIATPIVHNGAGITAEDWRATLERFHRQHQDLYAFQLRHRPIEMLSVAQDVIGIRPWSMHTVSRPGAAVGDAVKDRRRICFEADGLVRWLETPVYDGARLGMPAPQAA